ncbi:MAG TPA: electron transfer flavoprotein subunit alpha/FixB family protein [Acidimicrobiia bacterium]|nr:electron transfer flavoprotein subunit alpha/FixB family protein [Acidimicrobiia bacterium]
MRIWVFAEAAGGKVTTATLELLTKAREIGDTVEAIYAGSDAVDAVAASVGSHGATKLFVIDPGDGLPGQVAAAGIAQLAAEHSPDAILFAQTYDGRDAIARLSVKLDRPVLTNGMSLSGDGGLTFGTAIFGGVTLVDAKLTGGGPALIAMRPKSFAAEDAGGGAAEIVKVAAVDAGRAAEAKVLERHVEEQQGPKLEEASIVVSGGRGIGAAENYGPLVEELAKLLKGAWGASRAIVDAGWVPYALQVGQTGKTVKPKVYIALGISGATQHLVGMKNSDNIVAVNKDGEAPIFSVADLGIVGDVHKVVPQLIELLKSKQ